MLHLLSLTTRIQSQRLEAQITDPNVHADLPRSLAGDGIRPMTGAEVSRAVRQQVTEEHRRSPLRSHRDPEMGEFRLSSVTLTDNQFGRRV